MKWEQELNIDLIKSVSLLCNEQLLMKQIHYSSWSLPSSLSLEQQISLAVYFEILSAKIWTIYKFVTIAIVEDHMRLTNESCNCTKTAEG